LFNWGFNAFEKITLVPQGTTLSTAAVDFGVVDTIKAGLATPWTLLIPRGQATHMHTTVQLNPHLTAPIAKGAVLGKVVAELDGKPYAEQPLIAMEPVERAGFFKRMWQHLRKFFK